MEQKSVVIPQKELWNLESQILKLHGILYQIMEDYEEPCQAEIFEESRQTKEIDLNEIF